MVEAPGTAPGSDTLIPRGVYRHSRFPDLTNIGIPGPFLKMRPASRFGGRATGGGYVVGRKKLGKLVLTFVLVVGAIVSTAVDWNSTHLFNPAWHPHARFHDALFLMLLNGATLIVLWLLWRRSAEPEVAVAVSALFSAAVWTPFFYIEALIPGTSLLASNDVPVLRLGSLTLAPNLIVAAVMLFFTLVGYWLARGRRGDA